MAEATTLRVNMVTPVGPIATDETDAVTAPGEFGEFEVLPGHVPFLTALHPGVLTLGERQERRVFAVGRGYLRVDRAGGIEILVANAVEGGRVDVDAAETLRSELEAELETWKDKQQDGDFRNLKDRFDWAAAQLEAHKRA
ncbi:ATP synthase F1 subunit epsilon [Haliangium ochraceum]|uniref:ATP synthase epsilon chain n=1 Tax=Haliangium ochraceum (strain DSM 14365 / JCM 11303 / SMP-2) TaxID=502025 RepID=D0LL40_HALO1|nr:ATP synthase F1 subunit epsilon [Haliangium ochraceum]ACY18536.1 ATP synthase F1, epsilon subunit [Haliangium ochraceum DSM 14365]